jgi:hypothetical protein
MVIEQQEHYGVKVWTNVEMDSFRKHQCLCLLCSKLGNCEQASRLYEICKNNNLALAVTRCPEFIKKGI